MAEDQIYFVISNSDGDTCVDRFTEECLLEHLNRRLSEETNPPEFLTAEELTQSIDTNYWPSRKILIIKGAIAVPKQVKTIVEFGFPQ